MQNLRFRRVLTVINLKKLLKRIWGWRLHKLISVTWRTGEYVTTDPGQLLVFALEYQKAF